MGIVFEGDVYVPTDGVWTFGTISDDGSQLFIHDKKVVGNDGHHGPRERTGTIALKAGWHPIRVKYFEFVLGAMLETYYGSLDLSYGKIPADALRHGGSNRQAEFPAFAPPFNSEPGVFIKIFKFPTPQHVQPDYTNLHEDSTLV
jgi:hypothetical protein